MKRYCIKEDSQISDNNTKQQNVIIKGHDKLHLNIFTLYDAFRYNSLYNLPKKNGLQLYEDCLNFKVCDVITNPKAYDMLLNSDLYEILEKIRLQDIRENGTLYRILIKNNMMYFPECRSEIIEIMEMNKECKEIANIEEEMYGDLLFWELNEEIIELDVSMRIYYTILYHKNVESYVPFMKQEWETKIKEERRKERKEYKRYQRNSMGERKMPFEIKEKVENSIKIQDFAPEISRLYYSSREFRNIFKHVEDDIAKKYEYKNVKDIFENSQHLVKISRIEEIWLCERLLGFNLAITWYSFFYNILKGIEFETIKNEYGEIIKNIIKKVMGCSGIYSRNLIIERLKLICEIRLDANRCGKNVEFDSKELLDYIYYQILNVYMKDISFEKVEEVLFQNLKVDIEKVENKCLELKDKNLELKNGYYMLKRKIEIPAPQNSFEKNLFALIQKNVIENL